MEPRQLAFGPNLLTAIVFSFSSGIILDIFSYAYTNPVRLEFDGNIIESIREFNIDTQYSVKQLKSAKITPDISNQSLIKTRDSIINIIDQKTLIFVEEIDSIKKKLSDNIINNSNDYSEKLFIKELKEKKLISVNNFDKKADIKFNILQQPAFNKRFEILNENLQKHPTLTPPPTPTPTPTLTPALALALNLTLTRRACPSSPSS